MDLDYFKVHAMSLGVNLDKVQGPTGQLEMVRCISLSEDPLQVGHWCLSVTMDGCKRQKRGRQIEGVEE